jgi:hypothetical protein
MEKPPSTDRDRLLRLWAFPLAEGHPRPTLGPEMIEGKPDLLESRLGWVRPGMKDAR